MTSSLCRRPIDENDSIMHDHYVHALVSIVVLNLPFTLSNYSAIKDYEAYP